MVTVYTSQLRIKKSCIMPTVLNIIIITNTDHFLRSINVLLFLTETKCVLYEVGTVLLYRCTDEGGAMVQTRTFPGGRCNSTPTPSSFPHFSKKIKFPQPVHLTSMMILRYLCNRMSWKVMLFNFFYMETIMYVWITQKQASFLKFIVHIVVVISPHIHICGLDTLVKFQIVS